MRCLLVENYSNSRPRQTHRLTRQFLVAVRPTTLQIETATTQLVERLQNNRHGTKPLASGPSRHLRHTLIVRMVSSRSRAKIDEVTLDALRTRQSLVKGERLVRHEMRAVLIEFSMLES